MIFKAKPPARTYAERRYKRGLRSWQAKNRRAFAAYFGPFIVAAIVVGILDGDVIAWSAGLVAGSFLTMWIAFRETPPRYVETWHDGAEGERKAEKALRPLERAGWRVFHDVQYGKGNYDHIAVGTAGVYLFDSKNFQGIVAIRNGVPHLVRRHDPDEKPTFDWIRPHTLASAARLKKEIEQRAGHCPWVHAVVVFWSEFPESFVETDKCVFIEGSRLCAWLQSQPGRLSQADIEEIAAAVASIAEHGPADNVAAVSSRSSSA